MSDWRSSEGWRPVPDCRTPDPPDGEPGPWRDRSGAVMHGVYERVVRPVECGRPAYLEGVEHTVLTDWDGSGFDEWGGEPVYEQIAGGRPPSAPAEQDFWVASSEGQGQQVLDWDVAGGTWMVLVANADASRPVAVEAEAGLRLGWLVWVAVGFAVVGLLILALSAWGIYRRLRRP